MTIKQCACEDCGYEFEVKTRSEEEVRFCVFCGTELQIVEENDLVYFYEDDDIEEDEY